MSFDTQQKLTTSNGTAAAYMEGQWTIEEVRYPIAYGLFGHNFFVLKDPNGNFVAELNGLATGGDNAIKPIGFLPSDRLYAYVNTAREQSMYQSSYDHAVVKAGGYSDIMTSWRAAEEAGVEINNQNLRYPFLGIGSNSNSVASTLAAAMGVSENSVIANGSLLPSPGVGTLLLSTTEISNIKLETGVSGAIAVPESLNPATIGSLTPDQLAAATTAYRQMEYAGTAPISVMSMGDSATETIYGGPDGELSIVRRYFTDSSRSTLDVEIYLDRTADGRSFQNIVYYNPSNDIGECKFITREITETSNGQADFAPTAWSSDEISLLAFLPADYRTSSGFEIPLGDPFPGWDDYHPYDPPPYEDRNQYALTIDFFNQFSSQSHNHPVDMEHQKMFNWDDTPNPNPTTWIGDGEAFLVNAPAGTTGITSCNQLFGGIGDLTHLDSNSDGMLSTADAAWSNLSVWFGRTDWEAGQPHSTLLSLSDLGIESINLTNSGSSDLDFYGAPLESTINFIGGGSTIIRSSTFNYAEAPNY